MDCRVKSELDEKLDFLNFIIQKVNSNDAEKCKDYRVISVNQIEFLYDKNNKTFIIPREEYFDLLYCVHKMQVKRTMLLCLKKIFECLPNTLIKKYSTDFVEKNEKSAATSYNDSEDEDKPLFKKINNKRKHIVESDDEQEIQHSTDDSCVLNAA